jgi:hypothetical protein
MDHQPFETWILEDQSLTLEQKRKMDAHLRTCSSCLALTEVNLALKSVKMTSPAAGFTDRFKLRLETKKQDLRQRNIWGFIVLTFSVIGILIWISWPVIQDLFRSPFNYLASWISSMVVFWASLQAIVRAGIVLLKVVPGFVPTYIWTVILFAAGGVSLAWIVSLMKLTKGPQGV